MSIMADVKDFFIATLIGATSVALMVTPIVFIAIFAIEEEGYYHWLSLAPLAMIALFWVFFITRSKR